jgi:hypothetical protein
MIPHYMRKISRKETNNHTYIFLRICLGMYFIKKQQSSQIHQTTNKPQLRRNLARQYFDTVRQELNRHDLKKQKWTTRDTWGGQQTSALDIGGERCEEQAGA